MPHSTARNVTTDPDDELSSEQIAVLKDRLNQPDPLKLLANMVAVFADPARADRHIKQYQDAKAAAEKAQANLAGARVKHDHHIAAGNAELEAARASLRKREIDIVQREGRLHLAEERLREREDADARRSGRLEAFPGGMTRERELVPDNPDPHYPNAA
jgi:chromosome segregation ATPase